MIQLPTGRDIAIMALALLFIGAILGQGCMSGVRWLREHVRVEVRR